MRCRPGIVTSSESATIPDQQCTASRCTASGKRKLLLLRNTRSFAYGVPALVFARHEGAELRRRRAFDHDADRDQALAHLVVGDDVVEGLVQLGDDGGRDAGRTE